MYANHTFKKGERIVSKKLIEELFGGEKSRSMAVFPLRLVYMLGERSDGEEAAQLLISVPKRHFKRAVKRNRVKRQIREAYRMNKAIVMSRMAGRPATEKIAMAIIWTGNELVSTEEVSEKTTKLLQRLAEKL